MTGNVFKLIQRNLVPVLLVLFVSGQFQIAEVESTPIQNASPADAKQTERNQKNLNSNLFSQANEYLSPLHEKNENDFGLIEVNENEIPEDTEVYVLEESEEDGQKTSNEEIMQTANNIVFRPLFRYRGKQEALRRNSGGIRRRYFVPKRYYRRVYYPYYYPDGFHYY